MPKLNISLLRCSEGSSAGAETRVVAVSISARDHFMIYRNNYRNFHLTGEITEASVRTLKGPITDPHTQTVG